MKRHEPYALILVRIRVLPLESPGDANHIGLSLLKAGLRFEAGDDGHVLSQTIIPLLGSEGQRSVQIDFARKLKSGRQIGFARKLKITRRHADHRVRLVVERDRLPDYLRISAEAP